MRVQQPEELTKGGIYLPESSKVRPTSGQVVSLGDGRLPNGNQMEFTVKPGDEVRTRGAALCAVWIVYGDGLKGIQRRCADAQEATLAVPAHIEDVADRAQSEMAFKCTQYRRGAVSLARSIWSANASINKLTAP